MIAVLAALIVTLAAALGGVVYASDSAGPGDALYPVDLTVEQVQELLTTSDRGEAELTLKLADERLSEAADAQAAGDPADVDAAMAAFDEAIQKLNDLLASGDLTPEEQANVETTIAQLEDARAALGLGTLEELEIEVESEDGGLLEVQIDVEQSDDSGDDSSHDGEDDHGDDGEDDDEHDATVTPEPPVGTTTSGGTGTNPRTGDFSSSSGDDSGGGGGGGDDSSDDHGGDDHGDDDHEDDD